MKDRADSWERIWRNSSPESGFIHRIGRKLAEFGDIQRLVLSALRRTGSVAEESAVLEAGCGSGVVLGRLQKEVMFAAGVDKSHSSILITRQRGITAARADVRNLPFLDGSFDLVFSTGMVDLLSDDDSRAALGEMLRITRLQGYLVIVTAWSGCTLHERIKHYLISRNRWKYGSKRTFDSLADFLPSSGIQLTERRMGALSQLRFVSYLFEDNTLARRLYHGFYLITSMILWPLNRFPGALLVTTVKKLK